MRILYAETTAYYPSSAHFIEALTDMAARGECEYSFLDETNYIAAQPSLVDRAARRLLGRPPRGHSALNRALLARAASFRPDVVLVGKGANFAPQTLRALRAVSGASLINWATDDPFNPANGTRDLVESTALYDLYVCTKRAIMEDARRAGCANVAYVRFGYKPQVHFPEAPASDEERRRFESDVTFIGGADDDRAPYFEMLARAIPELRLHLHGGYWNRYPKLRRYWRGNATGRDFRLAIGGAKMAVNLVRRANRDDHVMRTFEIPACGGFMLTERSATHDELFSEDNEAAFFSSPDELVAKVRIYLGRDEDRARIAVAGHRKITQGRHTYGDRLAEIIQAARSVRELQGPAAVGGARTNGIESNG